MTAAKAPANTPPSPRIASVPRVSKEELQRRLSATLRHMDEKGIDVAIVTTPDNIYYLSGYFTRAITSNTALIINNKGGAVLVTRRSDEGNYLRIQDETTITRFVSFTDDMMAESMGLIGSIAVSEVPGCKVAGLEMDGIFTSHHHFSKLLRALAPVSAVDIGVTIDRQRWIKSDWELACHRAAAAITVEASNRALKRVQPGVTDSEIAADVAANSILLGSEWVCTWPIILTGAETGRAHSSWQGDKVAEGLPTTLEFAAVRHRYHSPIYRTVVFSPTDEQARYAEAVAEAHQACLDAMRPGALAEDIYEAKRAVLDRFGLADRSSGRAGYTVGIAFAPNWVQRNGVDLMKGNKTLLDAGMVFHIVTLVGRPNVFGVAQSSSAVVTRQGHEVLTVDGITRPILV